MTVTYSGFLERFPEFTPHPSGIVNGAIESATADVSSDDVLELRLIEQFVYLPPTSFQFNSLKWAYSMIGATDGKVYGKGLDATLYGQEFKRMSDSASDASIIGFVV